MFCAVVGFVPKKGKLNCSLLWITNNRFLFLAIDFLPDISRDNRQKSRFNLLNLLLHFDYNIYCQDLFVFAGYREGDGRKYLHHR